MKYIFMLFLVGVVFIYTPANSYNSQEEGIKEDIFLELIYRDSGFGGGGLRQFLPNDYITPAELTVLTYDQLKEIYFEKPSFESRYNSIPFEIHREIYELDDNEDTAEVSHPFVLGTMDVHEIEKITTQKVKRNASIVCGMFYLDGSIVKLNSTGSLSIDKSSISPNKYCGNVPFRTQKSVVSGTAFAINDSVVCSAYHYKYQMSDIAFVFDYTLKDDGVTIIPANRVFQAKRVLKFSEDIHDDYVLYVLDRKLPSQYAPLYVTFNNSMKGDPIYMIGHPYGWPMKISDNSYVKSVAGNRVLTDLDKFHFSSGSPVFNSKTHALTGMLVRGGTTDFEIDPISKCSTMYSTNYNNLNASVYVNISAIKP